jgi:peptidoglycan/xylan/chitin deacetylase (PgdA/CDA1 family)
MSTVPSATPATPSVGEGRAPGASPLERAARGALGRARSLLRSRGGARARRLLLRCLAPALEPWYAGIGSIPVFHRVVAPRTGERVGFAHRAESSVAQLEATIALLRGRRYAFLSLDELCVELGKPRARGAPRLAALTFDDGYRDNHDVVYPLLSSLGIPFAVYVATSFPDRSHVPWWYLLEERLLRQSTFAFDHGGRSFEWRLDSPAARRAAFAGTEAVMNSLALDPPQIRALCDRIFGAAEVERSIESLCLSWDMIRAMAASGLVTIGAHTVDHLRLPGLSLAAARAQIVGSGRRIEAEIGQKVRHFAYPFGAAGTRERDLVREAGFVSATTTYLANLVSEHRHHLLTLPRVHAELDGTVDDGDLATYRDWLSLQIRGAVPALANRGRRLITLGA